MKSIVQCQRQERCDFISILTMHSTVSRKTMVNICFQKSICKNGNISIPVRKMTLKTNYAGSCKARIPI